ncbi:putative RING-type E3 ubiquitin transferase [Microsporum canis]|uniref:DNA repair protein RAD5 n=1 Tax=Arthroderma otae (strain ATCC MYA-4605 / CBS 113480) TaxID=554155 RepID=C5FVY4_ARTOC|nr:DNA repair protein RAD5 [Microsporum canis CBS 113480]EEQ34068.1 DNA repair protein RAD5 [Microsporum canis CBS 113480]
MSSKRRIGLVDLTGDSPLSPSRKSSKAPTDGQQLRASQNSIDIAQGEPSTQMERDEELNAMQTAQDSQDLDDVAYLTSELYGHLQTKIVGVRFYNGHATYGECVLIKREATNKYDSNAVRVDNVMGHQIGHLPRVLVSRLAPYMDSNELLVEGTLSGEIGAYDCPITLRLFGTSEPEARAQLIEKMQRDKLPIGAAKAEIRKLKQEQAKKAKEDAARIRANAKVLAREKKGDIMFANLSQGTEPTQQTESLDELLSQSITFNPRETEKIVEKFGMDETELSQMPMADCPAQLSTKLLPYQRQGLAWMLDRESPSLPKEGSDEIVQLWKRVGKRYMNIATNYSSSSAPPLASGGILADDMGLGKTIQIISLILANSTPKTPKSSKTTLIISPLGVMSNWRDQIAAHIFDEHALSVLTYHGPGKKEAANLAKYDVVITTYGALASEYGQLLGATGKLAKAKKGLFSVHWRRVVLDEGHTIRTPKTKAARAACLLEADSRWSLTGTPIVNNLKDLYSQGKFIRLSGGLEDLPVFHSALIRPLNAGDENASLLLQALMATICLRRRKDMSFVNLRLPPMESHILHVKFLPHEKEKYDMFEAEAKGVFMDFRSNKKGKSTYSHVLEVLLRLRQVCNHWKLCHDRVKGLMDLLEKDKVVQLTPENMKALQTVLQLRIESQEECSICLESLNNPVITPCAHSFDYSCIEQVIELQHKCPLCRAEIKDCSALVSPAAELGEDSNEVEVDSESTSSKIQALIKILMAKGQVLGTKTVVFSQWTSFLDLIEPQLSLNNINFARIDGKMNSAKRDAAMRKLTHDPECTVMLASLNVCSVGLNLVAANQVILADSWWAPAIEDQAVDRVYRLGQTRPTTIWRLVMEDSIEDRVLDIQKEKRELMTTAFQEKAGPKDQAQRSRLADLEKLFR